MNKALLLALGSLLLFGCDQYSQSKAQSRYTVVQAGTRTILLDTAEGRAWELAVDQQGTSRGWAAIDSLPQGVR
jgi:hypothetical protein